MILAEELSKADPGIGGMLDVTCIVAEELYRFGTEEQKQKWLIPIVKGEKIGAFALTEPEAGSDAGATKTTAVLDGDNWVINGTKQFITNIALDNASIVILTAKCPQLENSLGKKRVINTFIVPRVRQALTLLHTGTNLHGSGYLLLNYVLIIVRFPKIIF